MAWEEHGDAKQALKHFEAAALKDNSDWYRLGVGWFSLKLGQGEKALDIFSKLIDSRQLDLHRRNIAKFFLALSHYVRGDNISDTNWKKTVWHRNIAKEMMERLQSAKHLDPFLRHGTYRWSSIPFDKYDAAKLSPDLKFFAFYNYR